MWWPESHARRNQTWAGGTEPTQVGKKTKQTREPEDDVSSKKVKRINTFLKSCSNEDHLAVCSCKIQQERSAARGKFGDPKRAHEPLWAAPFLRGCGRAGRLLRAGGRRDTRCPRLPAGCPEACATMNKVCKGACEGRPKGRAHEVARSIQKPPVSFALGLSCIPWGQRHGQVGVAGTQAPVRAQVPTGRCSFGAQSQRGWASAFSRPPGPPASPAHSRGPRPQPHLYGSVGKHLDFIPALLHAFKCDFITDI